MHFVLHGKNGCNFELVWLILKSYAPVVSVLGAGYYTLLNFLRHLLFTQLRIPRVMLGRFVSIVPKHETIPIWFCFSEKVDQALVVSFTITITNGAAWSVEF